MSSVKRSAGRAADAMRPVRFTRKRTMYAEGSVLSEFGNTQVLCTASVEERVPPFLKGTGSGWVTAEYGMLPRATNTRNMRESVRGRQSGRTQEIQRLIGRSLRSAVDLHAIDEYTITLDCDVLQADGGTRTAAISGAYIALHDALYKMQKEGRLRKMPVYGSIAAVSVGICGGEPMLDLDYAEDSTAEVDMNVVMNEMGAFIDLQGTAEGHAFQRDELNVLLDLARAGTRFVMKKQKETLEL